MDAGFITTLLLAVLAGGGVGVAIIQGIRESQAFKRERKAKREDDEAQNITSRLEKIETQTAAQTEALKFLLYDRIRYLGQTYVFAGEIDLDDQKLLHDMHKSFRENGGNGDLDPLMKQVDALPLKKK